MTWDYKKAMYHIVVTAVHPYGKEVIVYTSGWFAAEERREAVKYVDYARESSAPTVKILLRTRNDKNEWVSEQEFNGLMTQNDKGEWVLEEGLRGLLEKKEFPQNP